MSTLLPGSMRVECRPKLSFITCCYIQLVICRNDASQVEKAAKLSALTKKKTKISKIQKHFLTHVSNLSQLSVNWQFYVVIATMKYKVLRSKFFHDEIENMISFLYTNLLEPEIKVKIVLPFLTIQNAGAYAGPIPYKSWTF